MFIFDDDELDGERACARVAMSKASLADLSEFAHIEVFHGVLLGYGAKILKIDFCDVIRLPLNENK